MSKVAADEHLAYEAKANHLPKPTCPECETGGGLHVVGCTLAEAS